MEPRRELWSVALIVCSFLSVVAHGADPGTPPTIDYSKAIIVVTCSADMAPPASVDDEIIRGVLSGVTPEYALEALLEPLQQFSADTWGGFEVVIIRGDKGDTRQQLTQSDAGSALLVTILERVVTRRRRHPVDNLTSVDWTMSVSCESYKRRANGKWKKGATRRIEESGDDSVVVPTGGGLERLRSKGGDAAKIAGEIGTLLSNSLLEHFVPARIRRPDFSHPHKSIIVVVTNNTNRDINSLTLSVPCGYWKFGDKKVPVAARLQAKLRLQPGETKDVVFPFTKDTPPPSKLKWKEARISHVTF